MIKNINIKICRKFIVIENDTMNYFGSELNHDRKQFTTRKVQFSRPPSINYLKDVAYF